jgi:hypothetical protein
MREECTLPFSDDTSFRICYAELRSTGVLVQFKLCDGTAESHEWVGDRWHFREASESERVGVTGSFCGGNVHIEVIIISLTNVLKYPPTALHIFSLTVDEVLWRTAAKGKVP